jgi:hypothetical protein
MSKISRLSFLILVSLLVAGCATTPSAPPSPPSAAPMATPGEVPPPAEPAATAPAPIPAAAPVVATPPPALGEGAPATITGSEETSTMLDNFTAFVAEIDGVPVAAGRAGWNTSLTLKPGVRRLTLGFKRGVFSAQTIVELNVESRTAYQVRFASDAELFGKNSYCEFWIVNAATGAPVSPRIRSGLTRIEPAK